MRSSRGSLDSIGTAPAACEPMHDNSLGSRFLKMDLNNSGVTSNAQYQQHQHRQHNTGNASNRSQSCNGRDNWSKMSSAGSQELNEQMDQMMAANSSPSTRRNVNSGFNSANKTSSQQGNSPGSGRTKGVPPSFGYVKRSNGSPQQNMLMMGVGQIAHVSAVPRSAGNRRVSGSGTQTLPHDATSRLSLLKKKKIKYIKLFYFRNHT